MDRGFLGEVAARLRVLRMAKGAVFIKGIKKHSMVAVLELVLDGLRKGRYRL